MTEQEQKIEILKTIIIDAEFQGVCPPLTDDEFKQLRNNILSDGEVISPLIIWNGMLVDGHHRREIILNHTEIPFEIPIFKTEIPKSVRASESNLEGKSIFAHDKNGKVATAYEELTKEVMALGERTKDRSRNERCSR